MEGDNKKHATTEFNDIAVDDIIQMILAEAGFENPMNSHKFEYSYFCKIIYKQYESISILKENIHFRTTGTYPYSMFIDRVFIRMFVSGIFSNGWMAEGTKEYQKTNFESLTMSDQAAIKNIAERLKTACKLV